MRNFYLGMIETKSVGDVVQISADERHHIQFVLRLRSKDQVNFLDGKGNCYRVELQDAGKQLTGKILDRSYIAPKRPKITLFQGLPKSNKMEQIVRQTTEIGIDNIVPMICQRSAPKYDHKSVVKKVNRWQKISEQSAKQSRRRHFVTIELPVSSLNCLTEGANFDLAILLYESELEQSIKSILKRNKSPQTVSLFVGPEGGFTIKEVETATTNGILTASLGPNILRTETAPIVGVSLLTYELRNKNGCE